MTDTTASPVDGTAAALKWLNRAVAGSVVLVVGVFAWSAVQSKLPTGDKRPKCGIDWLLWASGSQETFNSALQKQVAASNRTFEDMVKKNQNPDLQRILNNPIKFEPIPTIDISQFNQPMRSSSTTSKRR